MATLAEILGGGLPAGLLTPEQEAQANQQANLQGLLGLSLATLAASQGRPGQSKPTFGQIAAQAIPVGLESYRGAFDQRLKDMLTSMQVKDMLAKKEREKKLQEIAGKLFQPKMGQVPATIPTETYEDYKTTVPGVEGVEINKAMLPVLGALGPEGMDYASKLMAFNKAMQPEEQILKPGDVVRRDGKVVFQAPTEFKGYESIDLGNTIAFVDPRDPTRVVGQMSKSKDPKELGGVEDTVRKEFLNQATPYIEIGQAYRKIGEAAKEPSAAGDLALIFGYMKMLDPGSVVREGEFANAQNAGGIPDRIQAQYNNILRGERLTPAQRQDFLNQAKNVIKSQKDNFDSTIKPFYEGIINQRSLKRSNVMFDPFGDIDFSVKPVKPTSVSTQTIPSIADLFNQASKSNSIIVRKVSP